MNFHINPTKLPNFEDWVAIDIETSGLDPYLEKFWSVALSDGEDVWIFEDCSGQTSFLRHKFLTDLLLDPEVTKIAHNMLFEYKWFMHHGIEIQGLYDTMLAEKLLAEDYLTPVSLEDTLARRVGVYMSKDTRESFITHPVGRPFNHDQILYMAEDVIHLGKVVEQQIPEVEDKNMQKVVELEFEVIPPVAYLEYYGQKLDQDLWLDQVGWMQVRLLEIELEMKEFLGKDYIIKVPGKSKGQDIIKDIDMETFNIRSTYHLRPLYKDKFGIETDSIDAEFIDSLLSTLDPNSEAYKFTAILGEHKKWTKRMGYDYAKFVHPVTGHVHTDYNQVGTRTGRFSNKKPNLQQVPKPEDIGPNMRHVWVADDENYVIIRADYAQQEARVMAYMSQDKAMIEAANSRDIYLFFGKHIFGYEIEKGSWERDVAKMFVLAVGFGCGPEELARRSGQDLQYCTDTRNLIHKRFPVMANYAHLMYKQVNNYRYVSTALGRRRYFDKPIFTEAVNTPIQGTAADMFKKALVKVHQGLTELKKSGKIDFKTRVWHIVHDELEVHCHKDEVEFIAPLVKQWMEEAGKEVCPDVEHLAELKYAYRWDK